MAAAEAHRVETAKLVKRLGDAERNGETARSETSRLAAEVVDLREAMKGKEAAAAGAQGQAAALALQKAAAETEVAHMRNQLAELHDQGLRAAEAEARLMVEAADLRRSLESEGAARAAAQKAAAETVEVLADERARHALEAKAWDRRQADAAEDWAGRLARSEAGWQAKCEHAASEAAAALEACKKDWARRFYLAEGDWARRLHVVGEEGMTRLDAAIADWQQRIEAERVGWQKERAMLRQEHEAAMAAATAAHSAAIDSLKQQAVSAAFAAQAVAQAELDATAKAWAEKRDVAVEAARRERNAAHQAWAEAAAQRERALLDQLQEAQHAAANRVAHAERTASDKVAAAEQRWAEERHELERRHDEQLRNAAATDNAAQAAQRARLEDALSRVADRVSELAAREARQEKRRRALLAQVTELRVASEAESTARREAESALRNASRLFKRELQEKNAALEVLRAEVAGLRSGAAAAAGWPGPLGSPAAVAYLPPPIPAVVLPSGSPLVAGSSVIAAYRGGGCSNEVMPTRSAYSSPGKAAVAHGSGGSAAQRELALLRVARRDYQQALAEQESLRACLTKAISDAVRVEPAVAAAAPSPQPRKTVLAADTVGTRAGTPVSRALF